MERQLRAGIAILMLSYFGACAPVSFDTLPAAKDAAVSEPYNCVGSECSYDVTEEKTVGEGLVDILIVNDNSGSMSAEQNKMATAFAGFLSSINNLDYRIAMTTTDVSDLRQRVGTLSNLGYNPPGPYNAYGALQDGKLIEFTSGLTYLERSNANKENLFNTTVKRAETAECEASLARHDSPSHCPAGDERPIAAMGLTIKNYLSTFARPTAHLAVIVLSDEDERSVSKYNPCSGYGSADAANCQAIKSAYPFESADEPQTVVNNFRSLYPNKTMSIHSIIVKPGDIGCRNAQTGQIPSPQPVLGFEGYAMAKLSSMTGGIVGNICESNYTSQLQNIGYTIGTQVTSLPFRCVPENNSYDVLFNGVKQTAGFSADFNTMVLTINTTLSPLTKVTLKYSCRK
ncbi:hypothetical protein BH10BDE1_BH10BDE1_30420 [soil metagenome]